MFVAADSAKYSHACKQLIKIWERFTQNFGQHSNNVFKLSANEKIMYLRLRKKLIANLWAMKHYLHQPYTGRLHLFLTKESLLQSPRVGWGDFADKEVKVHEILGTHRSITGDNMNVNEIHIQALAQKLRSCIDDELSGLPALA